MPYFLGTAIWALVPIVGSVALFTFLAVNGWAEQRRKEREAYYRFEFRKQLVAAGKMDADGVRDLMQFEQETELYRMRQSSVLAGFVLIGVGAGLLLGLQWIDEGIWTVGYIPLFIGAAIMTYALVVAPRSAPRPPRSFDSGGPTSDD